MTLLKKLQIALFLTIIQININLGQTSLNEMGLNPGKYKVGFKHYLAIDSTRSYKRIFDWNNKSIPRPIPVSIWYPSMEKVTKKEALKVLDYMVILKEEEEWEYLPNEHILNWFYYRNTDSNQNHLSEVTQAYRDLKIADGKFPVVLYSSGYEASSIENFALCEYLASHGYIVISSPSRGSETRYMDGGTLKDIETQARDIEFLLKEAGKFPKANLEQIASMGYSFGGLSNVLAQMRNDQIKAIVCLDGSIKYQYHKLKKSAFFDINKVNVPFLHMSQKDIPDTVLKEDKIDPALNSNFDFYDQLNKSRAFQLKFNHLTHPYFSTLGVLFQDRDKRQDKSDKEIMQSYRLLSKYTLNFLDAFLKKDKPALSFIANTPPENGIQAGLISHQQKKPKKTKPSFQDFNELAARKAYLNMEMIFNEFKRSFPDFEIPEGRLNNLGLQLVFNPKTSEQGIKVFQFACSLYPNSANLYDSLAEAYLFLKDKEKAILNFEKSLSLDNGNQNAINRLKQLRE